MHLPDPTFPPLLDGIAVKRPQEPFDLARAEAAAGRAGAGTVYWARATDHMDVAIVLEPEVPLEQAMHMPFAAMVAFGDALGALAPPELGVYYRWPCDIIVNGARAGQLRFAVPQDAAPGEQPDWLVIGFTVSMRDERPDPGLEPDRTSLYEEGCIEITRTDLIESFCRHFLVWINTWENEGFREIGEIWTARAREGSPDVDLDGQRAAILGLDESGNLLVKPEEGSPRALPILDHAWRGAETPA